MKTFLLIDGGLMFSNIPDEAEWEPMASELIRMQRHINWWLGDFIVKGEAQVGDDIYQAFDEDVSVSMLERCAAVSRAYPLDDRNPSISWSHHYMAMNLPPTIRSMALRKAEVEGMNTGEFKSYLSQLKAMS